jgi:hypothetical protein
LEAQGYTIMDDDRIHNVFPFARARARVRGIPVTPVTMVLFAPDGVHIPMYAYNGSWSTFYTSDWSRSFMFVTNEEAQAFVSSFLEWYASQDTE